MITKEGKELIESGKYLMVLSYRPKSDYHFQLNLFHSNGKLLVGSFLYMDDAKDSIKLYKSIYKDKIIVHLTKGMKDYLKENENSLTFL